MMVAGMASCGAACNLDEGDGDIPAPDQKDNAGTSTEESSEEEEDEEEEEDSDGFAEKGGEKNTGLVLSASPASSKSFTICDDTRSLQHLACVFTQSVRNNCIISWLVPVESEEPDVEGSCNESESAPQPDAEVSLAKDVPPKPCCEKCKAVQRSQDNELVTPRRISKGRLQVQLEGEGTYECSVTGLVFEVSERVLIRYSVLSWSKFGMFLRDSWRFAGPIFNVDCVNSPSSILTSIQFPHFLCLADPDSEMTFSVLHMKDSCPVIEPSVDHSGSHVKWRVSSLSPVGPIVQSSKPVEHHGVVLVYKELALENSYSFRIYLATNNSSDIKDIWNEVRCANKRYLKVEKPPTCKLDEKRYRLMSEPEGDISPADLPFTLAVTKLKGYFEVFFEQPPPFKVSLVETESDKTVWSATIREGDCVDNTVEKPRKLTNNRKRSTSTSEEELPKKRRRCADESDGVRTVQVPDVSSKQLMQVAKLQGKEWKQVAKRQGKE
uniref:Si:dkeyp-97b10.3 n=1 Tax=Oncorhynchus kisutch TaxID=8019 RepID=A0A8C7L1G9_ONCKI